MDNSIKKPAREKYYIDPHGFWASSAVMLMLLSALFRVIGSWGLWSESAYFYLQFLLPLACNLVYIACILLLGKKGFFLSIIPVVFGVVFFIIKATYFPNLIHMVLCILLYVVVLIIYSFTVFGVIHTKLLLIPLFGLPLIYHIFVEDMPALNNSAVPVTFSAGMLEMSVLCIMASMLCVGIGLKKRVPAPAAEQPENAEAPDDSKPEDVQIPSAEVPAAETVQTPAVSEEAVNEQSMTDAFTVEEPIYPEAEIQETETDET